MSLTALGTSPRWKQVVIGLETGDADADEGEAVPGDVVD